MDRTAAILRLAMVLGIVGEVGACGSDDASSSSTGTGGNSTGDASIGGTGGSPAVGGSNVGGAIHDASSGDSVFESDGAAGNASNDAAVPDVATEDTGFDCAACSEAQSSACLSEFEACYSDLGCQNIYACAKYKCALDASGGACAKTCMQAESTQSQAIFLALDDCLHCDKCKSACADYCTARDASGGT